MKKYIKPILSEENFEILDIIATSGDLNEDNINGDFGSKQPGDISGNFDFN